MGNSDIAWAAGIFEGEGCITRTNKSTKGNKGCYISLQLSMTDEDVVKRFAEAVGCGNVLGPYNWSKAPTHWKSSYLWRISNFQDVEAILTQFWPYLGERRKSKATELLAEYRSADVVRQSKQLMLF